METSILFNFPVAAMLAGWLVAQLIKLAIYAVRQRRFDYGFMLRLGGMPSSHSCAGAACTTAIGLLAGWYTVEFAIAAGMLFLIMVDAQGVRRAAGQQAKLLNQMAAEFYRDRRIQPKRLLEFLGHTPLEVFVGAMLGVAIAFALWFAFPAWAQHWAAHPVP